MFDKSIRIIGSQTDRGGCVQVLEDDKGQHLILLALPWNVVNIHPAQIDDIVANLLLAKGHINISHEKSWEEITTERLSSSS